MYIFLLKKYYTCIRIHIEASQVELVVKNLTANAGDPGSIPEWGRFPEVGNGSPLQHSCLENSMGRGTLWAAVHGATVTQLND